MDRREALKKVALIMGSTVIGTQAFLSSCQSENKNKAEETNLLFNQSDVALMDEIGETIIPTTDTPGAKAARVGNFMAIMIPDCYEEKDQKGFRKGLDKIHKDFQAQFGYSFIEGKPEERHRFLNRLDEEVLFYSETKKDEDPEHYFRIMKELTLLGYFTSEIGSTQALRYIQTPGRYDACVPYNGDRAWAV
jgi:hypothetical protein